MSRASCDGVLPTATMASTKGVEILPSGLTGTVVDSSSFWKTYTCNESPGPMRYFSETGAGTTGTGSAARLAIGDASNSNAPRMDRRLTGLAFIGGLFRGDAGRHFIIANLNMPEELKP